MWFFMISCYVLNLITLGMLVTALLQNFFGFMIFQANELTFIILTSIVYLFTETLVIFFFVGTGISVKEYSLQKKLNPGFHRKSIAIKRKVYPPLLFNMLLMMILFISLGAVDTHRIPEIAYQLYFLFCLWHFLYTKTAEHDAFRENTKNILAMADMDRKGL